MIHHIDHIGIAVKDLNISEDLYSKLLGVKAYKTETVESEGVTTCFFQVGETKIELLEATREDSPIAKFISKKGEGIHHIAFEVANIEDKIAELKEKGFVFIKEEPKRGADNKRIVFLHPKHTGSVLIELCESIKE